ncbi:MAG: neuroendocrine convertase 1, partial [Frankiales bacterium]|nr:neuroendocrine convertase 1 [Frankiales bacterium]
GTPGVHSVRSADVAVTASGLSVQPSKQDFAQELSSAVAQASAVAEALAVVTVEDVVTPSIGATTSVDTRQGVNVSEGDAAMRADVARHTYGADGTGIGVAVISSSVASLALTQARGELPAVTVLPGQSGNELNIGDEGTAMLEVVHDIAPGARLLFATAFGGGQAQYAQNIRDLQAAGADVIVDDVSYFEEPVFQDGPIAQAVEDVSAAGTLYFSSAGNSGNLQDRTSSTWEGDFRSSGVFAPDGGGDYLEFGPEGGGQYTNPITFASFARFRRVHLQWSDPVGTSGNDYDLYVLDAAGNVIGQSTDVQDGDDAPFEEVDLPYSGQPRRVVVERKNGAAARFLHVSIYAGSFAPSRTDTQPAYATTGATYGHSSAESAISVAAAPAAAARSVNEPSGPYPGSFTGAQVSELFSSEGPRRMFYEADGTPYNDDLSAGGGVVRAKPDVTAADGVQTSQPSFNPFFGTSAAAPHAAAVAALLRSAGGTATATRDALESTALDIEAPGDDPVTGRGIVMADSALAALGLRARALLDVGTPVVTPLGDRDAGVEPGEDALVDLPLRNISATTATAVSAVVTTTTPGVTLVGSAVIYPDIPPDKAAGAVVPVRLTIASDCACGTRVALQVDVTYADGRRLQAPVTVVLGSQGPTIATPYTGAPVPIPDPSVVLRPITAAVTLAPALIGDLDLSIDGSSCTSTSGATTVGLDHSYVSDLTLTLIAPSGTSAELSVRRGGAARNLCQLRFDDEAASPISSLPTPTTRATAGTVTGSYRPEAPLSVFDGEQAGGTWRLEAVDHVSEDTGTIRAFSVHVRPLTCDTRAAVPVGVDDQYDATQDTPLVVPSPGVLANDTDPPGYGLTAVVATQPARGSVTLAADGGFTYVPTAGTSGPDTFTYVADAGGLQSAPATVTIDVAKVNRPPTAMADSYSTDQDVALSVPAPGLLANDTDPDGDPLTAAVVQSTTHGTVTVTSGGGFSYQPGAGYAGPDSFTYTVSDGTATSAPVTVSLTVTPVQVPQAITFAGPSSPGVVGASVPLVATASPSGLPVTFRLGSSSTPGACTLNGTTLTYTGPGTCVVAADQAGSARYLPATTVTRSVVVAYTASGFTSPRPRSTLLKSGSTVHVRFVLRTADGNALPATTAVALAAAKAVTVTLTGPRVSATTAVCTWDRVGLQFQCQIKTAPGLRTGTTNPHTLTATQAVRAAGPGTSSVTLASQVIFFK